MSTDDVDEGVHPGFRGLMDVILKDVEVEMQLVHRKKRTGFGTVCGEYGQDTKHDERVTCPACKK